MALPQLIHEIRLSDHGSFWDENDPAVMVTDTRFFRNPHYHQPTDKPDTLNDEALMQVTLGVAGAVAKLIGTGVKFCRSLLDRVTLLDFCKKRQMCHKPVNSW